MVFSLYYRVRGYHGTKTSVADEINKNGFNYTTYDIYNTVSERLPNDLGFGTYFFIDDESTVSKGFVNAKNYTLKYKKKSNIDVISIVVADLTFNDDQFLDLDEADNTAYYLSIQRENEQEAHKIWSQGKKDSHQKRKILDGIFLEMMVSDLEIAAGKTIQGVQKKTFTSFGRAARSNFHNGAEIAVRDHSCICINRVSPI